MYREDSVTKTNDGGLKNMKCEHKVVWICPNTEDVARCPVRLVDKYLGLCPPYRKNNFYLRSLDNNNNFIFSHEQNMIRHSK